MPPSPEAQSLITKLNLTPHPEGGYYREMFRDTACTLGDTNRPISTSIYFLLTAGDISRLHKIDAAETWHLYAGKSDTGGPGTGVLEVVELGKGGPKVTRLSSGVSVDATGPQYTVPRDVWFGSRPAEGTEYVLVGCTVAPGFLFEKYELGERAGLLKDFPECKAEIEKLTP